MTVKFDGTWEDVYYVYDLNSRKLLSETSYTEDEAKEAIRFELSENPDAQLDVLQAVQWDAK